MSTALELPAATPAPLLAAEAPSAGAAAAPVAPPAPVAPVAEPPAASAPASIAADVADGATAAGADAAAGAEDASPAGAAGAEGARGSGDSGRTRWRVTAQETSVLEAVFASSPRPNKNTIHQLATMLGVKPRQVQVWFQNRRQRWRKDFLELEKARSQQMAELSGKVIDFHGDLLPPLTAASSAAVTMPPGWERLIAGTVGAAAPAAAPAAANAVSAVPTLGLPVAMPATAMPVSATPSTSQAASVASGADSVAVSASMDGAVAVAAAPVAAAPCATASTTYTSCDAEDTTFDAFDLCDLLAFPEAPVSTHAHAQPPAPPCAKGMMDADSGAPPLGAPLISRTNTNATSSNNSDGGAAVSDADADADADDTIWLGMEWLIDSDELAAHVPVVA